MWGLPQKQNARRAYKIRLCGHLRRYKNIVKKTYMIYNKFHNFFVYFRLFRRRLQWQPNLLPFLVFLFQKLLQLLHGFLDFIKTAAAGIFILIAEILEFLLKETWFSDQTSSPLSGVPDTGTGKVLFLLYYTGNVNIDQKIACFSHCFPIFFPL